MNYIDIDYLCEVFSPDEISAVGDGNTWKRLIDKACTKVDEITFGRIRGIGFDNLTPFQQSSIKKAVAYQAKYISECGYDGSEISSYSVGDISVSVKDGNSFAGRNNLDELAYSLLKQTGLARRSC